jgi:hypothetical protein
MAHFFAIPYLTTPTLTLSIDDADSRTTTALICAQLRFLSRITFGRYKKSKYSMVKMLILFYLIRPDEVSLPDKRSWFFGNKSRK